MHKFFLAVHLGILLVCFVSLLVNRKKLAFWFWPFFLLIGITLLVESTGFYLLYYTPGSSTIIFHYFVPVAYALIAFIYFKAIRSEWKRRVIAFSIPVFIAYHIYLSFYIQKPDEENSFAMIGSFFLIVLWSLFYLHELLVNSEVEKLSSNLLFWFSVGNLVFYTGAFFLMGLLNFLMKEEPALVRKLFYLMYFLNYILYSLYTIGFICSRQVQKS